MKVYDAASLRNVALVGHSGSGKTQLISALLFDAGAVNRLGKVDEGTTVTDYDEEAIADWVNAGGRLFASAGAGMFDEFNQPNEILRRLFGVEQRTLDVAAEPVQFEKQDLPFARPIDRVTWKSAADDANFATPANMRELAIVAAQTDRMEWAA